MDLSLLINTSLAQSTLTLAYTWNPVLTNLLVGLFLVIAFAMILLVLIQRPQGGGLSGAFGAGGGGGAGQTAFGTKTGDVLTGATITIFMLFLIFAIVLNFATRPQVPVASMPGISTPAQPGTGTLGDPVQDASEGNAEILDPAQAIEDTMSTTPSVESEPVGGDTPEPAADQPADQPAEQPGEQPGEQSSGNPIDDAGNAVRDN